MDYYIKGAVKDYLKIEQRNYWIQQRPKIKRSINEINYLAIPGMPNVTSLNTLKGAFVNLEYALASGQTVKLLNDNRIYLGNQLHKEGNDRCYGIATDEEYILVCEYEKNGSDPEIVVYIRR